MMFILSGITAVAAILTVPVLSAPIASQSPPNTPDCPDYCAGTTNSSMSNKYICGDPRLGPTTLPTKLPLSSLTNGYSRFGNLCPGEFLENWFNNTAGYYIYPPQAGFQLTSAPASVPIEGNMTLLAGTLVDRFGSEYGAFLAPYGSPYDQRALPPSNLDTPTTDPSYPYNYHVYEVLKDFEVLGGPIAAWFGQPGQGTQYELVKYANVMALLSMGLVRNVNLDELTGPPIEEAA